VVKSRRRDLEAALSDQGNLHVGTNPQPE